MTDDNIDNLEMDLPNVDAKIFDKKENENQEDVDKVIANDNNDENDREKESTEDELNQISNQEREAADDYSSVTEFNYSPPPDKSVLFTNLSKKVNSILANSFERYQ
jgi:hypothetical protein